MEKYISSTFEKFKELFTLYKSHRPMQYGVIIIYLILWLFSTGNLSTTIWVSFGIGLGWIIGKNEKKE
tara:strand:+ start:575 stop:778 length:204 start_codon:yes stop_codon:yes gene_type:complete